MQLFELGSKFNEANWAEEITLLTFGNLYLIVS